MSDLISRQDAIEAVYEALHTPLPCYGNNLLQDSMTLAKAIVNNIPSAEPEPEEFEWCHDCKEYDQEKHCCHRWTKVIRKTVKEVKSQWKWTPVTEALPEDGERVLTTIEVGNKGKKVRSGTYFKSLFQCDNGNVWTITDKEVIAWMPLPEPGEDNNA